MQLREFSREEIGNLFKQFKGVLNTSRKWFKTGGRVAEQLERWTCNSEAPSSSPVLPLPAFVVGSLEFKSSPLLKIANWFAFGQLGFLTPVYLI